MDRTFGNATRSLIFHVPRLPVRFLFPQPPSPSVRHPSFIPPRQPSLLAFPARVKERRAFLFPPRSLLFFLARPAYSARWRLYVSKCMQKTGAPRAS